MSQVSTPPTTTTRRSTASHSRHPPISTTQPMRMTGSVLDRTWSHEACRNGAVSTPHSPSRCRGLMPKRSSCWSSAALAICTTQSTAANRVIRAIAPPQLVGRTGEPARGRERRVSVTDPRVGRAVKCRLRRRRGRRRCAARWRRTGTRRGASCPARAPARRWRGRAGCALPDFSGVHGSTHCRQVSVEGTAASRAACHGPVVDLHLDLGHPDVLVPRDAGDRDGLAHVDRLARCWAGRCARRAGSAAPCAQPPCTQ